MSGEIEKYEAQHPVGGNPDHLRLSIDDCWRVARYLSASGMFQNGRNKMKPEECMAIIMAGQGLGIAPAVAMMNFHMIEGRPEMSAFLQSYFIKASGKYDYRAKHTRDGEGNYVACTVDVIDTRSGEVIGVSEFTLQDAKNAGLIRPGGNYLKYAGNMLLARAMSNAMAWHAPDSVPIRVYADGEIGGRDIEKAEQGVVAVEGEARVRPEQVADAVSAALAAEPEEEIEDAEIVEPEPNVGADPDADPLGPEIAALEGDVTFVERTAEEQLRNELRGRIPELDRFSPQAVETRLRDDLPKLDENAKVAIKAMVEEASLPFSYASIVKLIVDSGHSDVFSFLRAAQERLTGTPAPQEGDSLPKGVTGRQTGSQTQATISDSQVRMFNARCSDCGFTEAERKTFLRKFCQVESSKAIAKADFDDILAALNDIHTGGEPTKAAYLGD